MIRQMAASALWLFAVMSGALAQGEKRLPPDKISPRPVQPAQKQPPAKQSQPPQAPQPPGGLPQAAGAPMALPPIVYSPWTKFCGKDNASADAREACLTMKEARLETGQFLAGAALIEQQDKKVVRITVPLTMQLAPGTRLQVDQEPAIAGRYVVCIPNGCIADHEFDAGFVARLKQGQQIILHSINMSGQVAYIPIPLADFAKVNEGPATDPKKYEEEQKRLQEELLKKQRK